MKKEVQVKKEMQCYRWLQGASTSDEAIKKNAVGTQRPVTCDICHVRFPRKFGSWACESCVADMIGSQ